MVKDELIIINAFPKDETTPPVIKINFENWIVQSDYD